MPAEPPSPTERLEELARLHRAVMEPHPKPETSDRDDAVTLQNVDAYNHNSWLRRVTAARIQLVEAVGNYLRAHAQGDVS